MTPESPDFVVSGLNNLLHCIIYHLKLYLHVQLAKIIQKEINKAIRGVLQFSP